MEWKPKQARSAVMQVCAMLLLRPDNVETEVQILASSVLYNPAVFASESAFRAFLKTNLGWNDQHLDSLIEQMSQNPPEDDTQ